MGVFLPPPCKIRWSNTLGNLGQLFKSLGQRVVDEYYCKVQNYRIF